MPVAGEADDNREFVTMFVDNQLFGIPVLQVQDVLSPQKITRVPLAPREVAGSLNLRGRIVTAIDVRVRLGLAQREKGKKNMSVVVDYNGEFYSLIVDQVGEVMTLSSSAYEKTPTTLDEKWREVADGVYRLQEQLMIVLDVKRLLRVTEMVAA
ncbi:MAG: chemotaxis protein CheW [Alphaproteobacteria bacterium]|nr:chemotaxis protein CheW [Alphaproteobacteria bacterium]